MSTLSGFNGSETELVPGVLRGYRAWRVETTHRRLISFASPCMWQPGANKAFCQRDIGLSACWSSRNSAPNPECSCGYYGHYCPSVSCDYLAVEWHWRPNIFLMEGVYGRLFPKVWGSITVHGRVVLGEKGFRAEYATVEAIVAHPSLWSLIREHYEVSLFATADELIEAFPPQDMSHLLGRDRPKLLWGTDQ